MCASCKCGCKPGKPAKGCDCQCKECRAARESVGKSFSDLSLIAKASWKEAVNLSKAMKMKSRENYVANAGALSGAIGGSILGAHATRRLRRRPAVMLGTTVAGSLAGAVAGTAATGPLRRKMANKKAAQMNVGKSLSDLGVVAKASPFGSMGNAFKGVGSLKPVGGDMKRRMTNNAAVASVQRKRRMNDSVSPFKDMSNPLRRIM